MSALNPILTLKTGHCLMSFDASQRRAEHQRLDPSVPVKQALLK
jgi:hypothetical protein